MQKKECFLVFVRREFIVHLFLKSFFLNEFMVALSFTKFSYFCVDQKTNLAKTTEQCLTIGIHVLIKSFSIKNIKLA